MPADPDIARRKLEARRAELMQLSEQSRDDRAPVALDQQSVGRLSRMDALQRQAMSEAQERRRATELQRIDVALRRIRDGDYGYCDQCGAAIAEGRLEIDPAATLCITCAR
ncbi:MAG: TraR/DksA family transcriptional regulator [Pseudomonadota bacterium]